MHSSQAPSQKARQTGKGQTPYARVGLVILAGLIVVVSLVVFVPPSLLGNYYDEPMAEPVTIPEALVHNFVPVHPYLFRGGTPSPFGLKALRDLGVKTVIDFRVKKRLVEPERDVAAGLGLTYVNLPCAVTPSVSQFKSFFEIVDRSRRDGHPVFVHCANGTDRTGLAIASWRVCRDGWSVAAALNEMFQRGFVKRHLPFAAAEGN